MSKRQKRCDVMKVSVLTTLRQIC